LDAARIYVPLEGGGLVALLRSSGADAWRSQLDVETSWPPIAAPDSIFVVAGATVYQLDAATGRTRRETKVPGQTSAPPTLAGPLLLVPIEPDAVVAIRHDEGRIAWTAVVRSRVRVGVAVNADATVAYVSLENGRVIALSLAGGNEIWSTLIGGELGSPIVAGDRIFVGSTDNSLYSRNASNGRALWRWLTGGDIVGAVLDDRRVYLTSFDNTVRALDRGSGNQRWLTATGTRPVSPPQLVRGQLLLAGVAPTLALFDPTTGKAGATFALAGDLETATLHGPPLVASDVVDSAEAALILIMRDGRVVGLRPDAAPASAPASPPATAATPEVTPSK
jgi:outer membrane protein assembly factor BamB